MKQCIIFLLCTNIFLNETRIQLLCILYPNITVAPLVYINPKEKKRTAILVGITAWVSACGYAEWPDVYGRVSHVTEWITENTGQNKIKINFQTNKDFNLFFLFK